MQIELRSPSGYNFMIHTKDMELASKWLASYIPSIGHDAIIGAPWSLRIFAADQTEAAYLKKMNDLNMAQIFVNSANMFKLAKTFTDMGDEMLKVERRTNRQHTPPGT